MPDVPGSGDAVILEVALGVHVGHRPAETRDPGADLDRRVGVEPELAAAHLERALRALERGGRGEDEEDLVHGFIDLRGDGVGVGASCSVNFARGPARAAKSIGEGRDTGQERRARRWGSFSGAARHVNEILLSGETARSPRDFGSREGRRPVCGAPLWPCETLCRFAAEKAVAASVSTH